MGGRMSGRAQVAGQQARLFGSENRFIIPELLGRKFAFCRSWMIEYEYSYYTDEGRLCHEGTVVGSGPGVGIQLGGQWGWWADDGLLRLLA